MKTKHLVAMLSALVMAGVMASCSSGGSSTPAQTTQSATTAAADTAAVTTTKATTTTTTTTKPDPVFVDDTKGEAVPEGALTFEKDSLYTAHAMGGGGDEADVELALVDFDGDKKLRVRTLREGDADFKVPKIVFNLAELIGAENTGKIGHISVDFTTMAREEWLNDDGSTSLVVGNFLGAVAGNIAKEKGKDADGNLVQNDWATHIEFEYKDWDNFGHTWRCETDIPAMKLQMNAYAENNDSATLVIMRWGQKNAVDFYIDNISILDKEGKPIPIIYDAEKNPAPVEKDSASPVASGSAGSETTAAGSETTAAGAETTSAAAASTTAAESATAAESTSAVESTSAAS